MATSQARLSACSALLATLLCGAATPALAQAVSTAPSVGSGISQEQALALSARLDALERQNAELARRLEELGAQSTAGDAAIRKDLGKAKVSMDNGRPAFASADGRFTANLNGFFQLDGAIYDQDSAGPLATDFRRGSYGSADEAERARDFADGMNFRRVRFGMNGKAFGDWDYNFLFDFGGSGNEPGGVINQAWVQYSGLEHVKLRIGAFPPQSNMDDQTSTTALVLLERSAVSEVVRGMAAGDGRTAVAILAGGDRWNLSAAVTGNLVGQSSFDEQLGLVGRATFVPLKTDRALVHLGANVSMLVNPPSSGPDLGAGSPTTNVRFRERVESRVEGVRLVDTGSINADGATIWGLEAAAQYGPVYVQSEYFDLGIDRKGGALPDPDFSGWYVQGAWTLTGQPRRYSATSGAFGSPKVDKPFDLQAGTWGVWEVAARYSNLDLNDGAVLGGEQDVVTVGLNWYPNSSVRFQANFQNVEVDRISPGGTAWGAGVLTPPAGAQVGQDLKVWSFRTQYAF
ncbi:MAG: OprO/OprP family phosphate-selective porin [Pseudomonadota bacterium]